MRRYLSDETVAQAVLCCVVLCYGLNAINEGPQTGAALELAQCFYIYLYYSTEAYTAYDGL